VTRSNADKLALKAELTNDPKDLGLTLLPEDDLANANKLNAVSTALQIDRTAIPISEIAVNIDRDEYAALPAADRDWLNLISVGGTINPRTGGEVREGLLQLFGAGTETRANLVALLTESTNRIEQMYREGLLAVGGTVTPSEVSDARQYVT
jgi:hypothetical protein